MGRHVQVVRLSSKGQIIIPVAFRRQLSLKTGQPLTVRAQGTSAIVFSPLDKNSRDLASMLERARSWLKTSGRDLVEELHERRENERQREVAKGVRRRH